MTITMKKADVLKRLNERLADAEAYDAEQLKKHKADEVKALAKFRAQLRHALKWDWETAKKNYFDVRFREQPTCPTRSTGPIKGAINMVSFASADRLQIRDGTDLHRAVFWVRPDKREKSNLCD
jgi:hypothetical protein